MNEIQSYFKNFASTMDQNTKGVQYAVYTISGLAFLYAYRKSRPFLKFVRPQDIPKHFVKKNHQFSGKVMKVEPSSEVGKNPVLIVDHYPLIPLPWKKTNTGLPIEVSSINVTFSGLAWMQIILVGNEIKFKPLRIDKDRVHSIVETKRGNVANQLVATGLATLSSHDLRLQKDLSYMKYYNSLFSKELGAKFNEAGIWSDSKSKRKKPLKYMLYRILDKFQLGDQIRRFVPASSL